MVFWLKLRLMLKGSDFLLSNALTISKRKRSVSQEGAHGHKPREYQTCSAFSVKFAWMLGPKSALQNLIRLDSEIDSLVIRLHFYL